MDSGGSAAFRAESLRLSDRRLELIEAPPRSGIAVAIGSETLTESQRLSAQNAAEPQKDSATISVACFPPVATASCHCLLPLFSVLNSLKNF